MIKKIVAVSPTTSNAVFSGSIAGKWNLLELDISTVPSVAAKQLLELCTYADENQELTDIHASI